MKTYTFPAYISFGKFDNASTEVDVTLADEEALLLKKYAEEYYYSFDECEPLKSVYEKVLHAADIQLTDELRFSDEELGTDYCARAKKLDDPSKWTAGFDYQIGVNFPTEFEPII